MTLRGARVGPTLEISGERNGRSSSSALLLTPGLGWAFSVPMRGGIRPGTMFADIAWTMLLLLPFAYWAACAAFSAPLVWHLTRLGLLAIGVGVVPLIFGIGPSHWWEWLAGVVALLIGHFAGAAGDSAD